MLIIINQQVNECIIRSDCSVMAKHFLWHCAAMDMVAVAVTCILVVENIK